MIILMERAWQFRMFVLVAVLVVTGAFAVTSVAADEGRCCGNADMGSCTLDYPYKYCDVAPDCGNPYFPNCCFAGGFCRAKAE